MGALVYLSPGVAKAHFWATVIFGGWFATSTRRPSVIAVLAAYVVGAEVLWRMSEAALFWETGKYVVTALLLVGLARFQHSRPIYAPVLYFVLLTPGLILLAQAAGDFGVMRRQASFNLSGPLALAVAVAFFKQWPLSRVHLGEILVAAVGPVATIATLTVLSTYGSDISFIDASNLATSGGFGPNQVSGALSAGAVLCFFLLATQTGLGARTRAFVFGTMVLCAVQSAMTFSRGGVYMAVIATVGASMFLLGDRSGRRMVVSSALAIVLSFLVIAPGLISFTGGALEDRFRDTSSTGRFDLTKDDLQIWADRPVFGAGVGQSRSIRALFGRAAAAHTEWTRLLAEHGVFGLAAMLVLLWMMAGSLLRARGPVGKALVVGLVLWSAAFLAINDMRIVAPSFLIGLAAATVEFPAGIPSPALRRRMHRFQSAGVRS